MAEKLYFVSRTEPGSIRETIARLELHQPPPQWSWLEPRPGARLGITLAAGDPELHPLLRPGLHPLLAPDGLALAAIDEARLFWPDGAVHLLDSGSDTTRCLRWSLQPRAEFEFIETDRTVAPYSILLKDQTAFAPFGLDVPEVYHDKDLEIVECWHRSVLFAWTLRDRVAQDPEHRISARRNIVWNPFAVILDWWSRRWSQYKQ